VYLDDERLGVVSLPRDTAKLVTTPPAKHTVEAGRHVVTLRFASRRPAVDDPYAEIDWIWLGQVKELDANYAAPTLEDIVGDVVLKNEPRRSLILRAPSTIRCTVHASRGSHLELSLGYWGAGEGTAQLRALVDGEAPVVLAENSARGGDDAEWQPISVDLSRFESKLVALELAVTDGRGGGRMAFGEPQLTIDSPPPPETLRRAQNVVLVIESGLERRALPPWGSAQGFRALGEIARQGVTFNGYRAETTVTSSVVASLLTGLSQRAHTLEDPNARLPNAISTLGEMLKEVGGSTAMFTGVPTSFPAFGFDEGWDKFATYSPVQDLAATQPYADAASWLKEQITVAPKMKRLVVIHARGGHPPWDLTRAQVAELPPEEYSGMLDARRGGIILAQQRSRGAPIKNRLPNEEWVRLRAMQAATLRKQDQALFHLIEVLEEGGQWDDTLLVFVGDVAMGDPPAVPFGSAAFAEDRLIPPLLVKFPDSAYRGRQINSLCSSEEVARTIMEALELGAAPSVSGDTLLAAVTGLEPPLGRSSVALVGNEFSTRLGSWLLEGEFRATPRLCNLDVDPSCVHDIFALNPIVASALWRNTFDAYRDVANNPWKRQSAEIDKELGAELTVWGE
jgi:hypothetical protein